MLRDTQLGLPAILNNALGSRAGAVLAVPLFGLLTISRRGLYSRGGVAPSWWRSIDVIVNVAKGVWERD